MCSKIIRRCRRSLAQNVPATAGSPSLAQSTGDQSASTTVQTLFSVEAQKVLRMTQEQEYHSHPKQHRGETRSELYRLFVAKIASFCNVDIRGSRVEHDQSTEAVGTPFGCLKIGFTDLQNEGMPLLLFKLSCVLCVDCSVFDSSDSSLVFACQIYLLRGPLL